MHFRECYRKLMVHLATSLHILIRDVMPLMYLTKLYLYQPEFPLETVF